MTARPRPFSTSLYTDDSVPPWRKCELTFRAERRCRVDALVAWDQFRVEGRPSLPVTLEPGETFRIRLANETGIEHMAGVQVHGVEL